MSKFLSTLAGALAISACGAATATAADPVATGFSGVVAYDTGEFDALPWYASVKVGAALPGAINITATSPLGFPDLVGSSTFEAGFMGAAALGKYLTPNVRTEVEFFIANNPGRSFDGNFVGGIASSGPLTGSVTTTSLMAVGYYEFTEFGNFVPYLSAGLGGAHISSNLTYDDTAAGFGDGTITGNSIVLAGRIGAGMRLALTDTIDVTVDYTAMLGSNANLTWTDPTGAFTRNVNASVMAHTLAVGIKGRF